MRNTLIEITRLLWSIGDAFDEMDHSDKDLWAKIGEVESRITELAQLLPDAGAEGEIKRKILGYDYLWIWWGNCIDLIEELTDIRRGCRE